MLNKAGFTDEMLELLRSMKGKVFKSYECTSKQPGKYADGNLRINLSRFAIDVSCDLYPLDGEPAGFDEMTWLSCEYADLKSDFRPRVATEPRQYLVNEVVTSIEIVRDYADHDKGAFVFEMDVALIINTKHHAYSFARGIWFSDSISIEVLPKKTNPGKLCPIDELRVDDDRTVVVKRSNSML
ncbi:MAG: hypothetical protein IJ131_00200 [Eggerthellaceae bacterium]|nr:hypothetical protein [Eggerthellaceae bacterium]